MKTIIITSAIAIAVLATMATPTSNISIQYTSSYCEGYETGWKEGFCYTRIGCYPPPPPPCPVPDYRYPINYQRGYQQGLLDGIKYEADMPR